MPEKIAPAYTKRLPLFIKAYDDEKGRLMGTTSGVASSTDYRQRAVENWRIPIPC